MCKIKLYQFEKQMWIKINLLNQSLNLVPEEILLMSF